MSYATQSTLAADQDFLSRCTACAATQALPEGVEPYSWVQQQRWSLAASPGFDAAYESAIVAGIGRPGWDDSVITDPMILSTVQALLAA
jgi:hypothetical protein